MKRFLTGIGYLLTIIIPVLCILGAVFCGVSIVLEALSEIQTNIFTSDYFLSQTKWNLILFVVCIIAVAPLEKLRRRLRTIYETDSEGLNRKYNKYEKLSYEQRKAFDIQRLAEQESLISGNELKRITHPGSKNPDKDMVNLVGLSDVKEQMFEMSARMEYDRKHKTKQTNPMHMCFMGPPGTGKTTVARIMTGFLYKNHYIRENKCIEINGAYLDSVKKTRLILTKAKGGVLFIDEAYSLYTQTAEGMQIVSEIVKAMEDNGSSFILILAGYGNEVRALIESNPGLDSRIKYQLTFDSYSLSELRTIFCKMAQSEGIAVDEECFDKLDTYFINAAQSQNFGNARTARNYLDKCIDKHSLNLKRNLLPKTKENILCEIDLPDVDFSQERINNIERQVREVFFTDWE